MKNATTEQNVYTRVTNKIVADLAAGARPWMKPWSAANTTGKITLPLRHNGIPYRGINILLLWGTAIEKGYASPRWMTFKQALELGGNVRKGEHGSLVVYANTVTRTEANGSGDDIERDIHFLKGYTVFNVAQIDGLPDCYLKADGNQIAISNDRVALHAASEAFFARTGALFRHGGHRAFYAHGGDYIQLPPPEAFRDIESYAATKAHELGHWTGHPSRLARTFGKRFGDDAYAFEELVAELAAAFLSVQLGLTPEIREDHAAYLGAWLKVLKADKRAIFTAASHAQKAVDYLKGLNQQEGLAA